MQRKPTRPWLPTISSGRARPATNVQHALEVLVVFLDLLQVNYFSSGQGRRNSLVATAGGAWGVSRRLTSRTHSPNTKRSHAVVAS